jgi:hypothetical protein
VKSPKIDVFGHLTGRIGASADFLYALTGRIGASTDFLYALTGRMTPPADFLYPFALMRDLPSDFLYAPTGRTTPLEEFENGKEIYFFLVTKPLLRNLLNPKSVTKLGLSNERKSWGLVTRGKAGA